jgi:transcriptional regulator with XRE-family HTH domain
MPSGKLPKSLYSPLYQRFLELLQAARIHARMTQVDAARRLGKPQSFVSKCESGERRVDVAEFLFFCHVYEVDPSDLIRKLQITEPRPRRTLKKRT